MNEFQNHYAKWKKTCTITYSMIFKWNSRKDITADLWLIGSVVKKINWERDRREVLGCWKYFTFWLWLYDYTFIETYLHVHWKSVNFVCALFLSAVDITWNLLCTCRNLGNVRMNRWLGWWVHSVINRWWIIELHTWNIYKFY